MLLVIRYWVVPVTALICAVSWAVIRLIMHAPVLSMRYRRFSLTAAAGLSVSGGVELVQLAMPLMLIARRSVDVDDVILNVTGTCLGYLIWRGAHALARTSAQGPGVLKDAA